MVFFINRCKNRILHFLKTLHFNPAVLQPTELPVLKTVPPSLNPHLVIQINFHHFFIIHDPGSPEKSLGTSHKRAIKSKATKPQKPLLWAVQSSLHWQPASQAVLKPVDRLSLPDPALSVRSCEVHRKGAHAVSVGGDRWVSA